MMLGLSSWLAACSRWLSCSHVHEDSCIADTYVAMCLQDPRVVVSALMKLAGGSPSLAKELNVDAFLQQVPHFWHSAVTGGRHVFTPQTCCGDCHDDPAVSQPRF